MSTQAATYPGQHRRLADFEALSFDCYGTLIDWEAGIAAVLGPWARSRGLGLDEQALLETYAGEEARAEREHPAALYPDILARSFRALGARVGAEVTDADAQALAASVPDWPAFPDSPAALAELSRHYQLIILSNVDRQSFAASNERLGVTFEAVVTADEVGSYKPAQANFDALLGTLAGLRISGSKLLHVAQSLFHDHVPAQEGRAADGVDQPPPRPARMGGYTAAAGARPARLGVPLHAGLRRRRGRRGPLLSLSACRVSAADLLAQTISHGRAFGPVPDPAQHLLAHQEADRFGGLDEEPGPRPGVGVSLPHQQPCCPRQALQENERPGEVIGGRHFPHRHTTAQDQ